MQRRQFLKAGGAMTASGLWLSQPSWAQAALSNDGAEKKYARLLILVELKGANDGLNTLVPFADPLYSQLRPRLAIPRDQLLMLSEREALHPSLAALMPVWQARELAWVQGVGYPNANLSHFRSIEIWDTASGSDEYRDAGWLARLFELEPTPKRFAADGVIVGSNDLGPLSSSGGTGIRAIALADPQRFLQQARLAQSREGGQSKALRHILSVERDIQHAASTLKADHVFKTEFPTGPFGNQVRSAAQLVASEAGMAVIRLTLSGFDTHAGQMGTHANLLRELAEGLAALRAALIEINRWQTTLIMSYAEFGRRPRENQSGGTDHGTANAHFLMGGRVAGGLFGQAPRLQQLDGNGNLRHAVDFRSLYATVMEDWWATGAKTSAAVLGERFARMEGLIV